MSNNEPELRRTRKNWGFQHLWGMKTKVFHNVDAEPSDPNGVRVCLHNAPKRSPERDLRLSDRFSTRCTHYFVA